MRNTIGGTPLYMAPEVREGKLHNEKADLYSFGTIMWELWYGECVMKLLKYRQVAVNIKILLNVNVFVHSIFVMSI